MVPGNSSGYETAATILGGGAAPEYIIIGVLSFLLGVCVTILCFRVHLLDKEDQAEQRGTTPMELIINLLQFSSPCWASV